MHFIYIRNISENKRKSYSFGNSSVGNCLILRNDCKSTEGVMKKLRENGRTEFTFTCIERFFILLCFFFLYYVFYLKAFYW